MTTPNIDISNFVYCGVCYDYFDGIFSLRGHVNRCHGQGLTCLKCPNTQLVPTDIKPHMKEVHNLEKTCLCTCCLDLFLNGADRDRHEEKAHLVRPTRPDIGMIATSQYAPRTFLKHVLIRRKEFGEHYAEQICAFYVSRRPSSERASVDILHTILDKHLEVTFQNFPRDVVEKRRSEMFNKAMSDETTENQDHISECLRQRQPSEQQGWAQHQPVFYQPTAPTMNPNVGPMYSVHGGFHPAMYGVPNHGQFQDPDPMCTTYYGASYYPQPVLPRVNPYAYQSFPVPHQNQVGQPTNYPVQFQPHDYRHGTGPSTSQQNFGPPDQQQ